MFQTTILAWLRSKLFALDSVGRTGEREPGKIGSGRGKDERWKTAREEFKKKGVGPGDAKCRR